MDDFKLISVTIITLFTIAVIGISACDYRNNNLTRDRNKYHQEMADKGYCYINNAWMRCTILLEK